MQLLAGCNLLATVKKNCGRAKFCFKTSVICTRFRLKNDMIQDNNNNNNNNSNNNTSNTNNNNSNNKNNTVLDAVEI